MATQNTKTAAPVVVETPKRDIETTINGNILTLEFRHGEKLVLDASTLTDEIRQYALMDRLRAKLQDGAAISRNKDTGRSATIEEKFAAVKEIYDRLTDPTDPRWDKGSRASPKLTSDEYLIMALMQIKSKDEATVRAFVETKTKEQRAALRKVPDVAKVIVELMGKGGNDKGEELISELDAL